jgi:hypothetical protein
MHGKAARHKRDALAVATLVLGVSLFHLHGILPGQTFVPVDLANNNLPWTSGSYRPLQNWLISGLPHHRYEPAAGSAWQASWL